MNYASVAPPSVVCKAIFDGRKLTDTNVRCVVHCDVHKIFTKIGEMMSKICLKSIREQTRTHSLLRGSQSSNKIIFILFRHRCSELFGLFSVQ
jgi:hypothetical protein